MRNLGSDGLCRRGELAVPGKTILEIPVAEQAQMRRELRAARYGYLLALHVLLLCAEGLYVFRHFTDRFHTFH